MGQRNSAREFLLEFKVSPRKEGKHQVLGGAIYSIMEPIIFLFHPDLHKVLNYYLLEILFYLIKEMSLPSSYLR